MAELLVRLADALVPDEAQPTEAGLAALRASLDARLTWPAGPTAARTRRKRWRSWAGRSRRGLVALGLIGGVSVGGTGVALATGAPLPEPVRVVAHHLGLPVGSRAPRPGHPVEASGLRADRAAGASTGAAAKVPAARDRATQPGQRGDPDTPRPGAPPQLLSRSSSFESGWAWPLAGDRRHRPDATGRHPLPEAPATHVHNSSDPDGPPAHHSPPGAEPDPGRPGTGGDPAGSRGLAAAVWAGGEGQPRRQAAASIKPGARSPDQPCWCATDLSCPPS